MMGYFLGAIAFVVTVIMMHEPTELPMYNPVVDSAKVIELGQCRDYSCSMKIDNIEQFINTDTPASIGQTVYKRCSLDKTKCIWSTSNKVYD